MSLSLPRSLRPGLDISNANTMIIQDCGTGFGLSQLYQLRGTGWGGSKPDGNMHFLLYRRDKLLKEVAEKTTCGDQGIYRSWGPVFKIAMRDLEIRGAGQSARGSPERAHGGSGV